MLSISEKSEKHLNCRDSPQNNIKNDASSSSLKLLKRYYSFQIKSFCHHAVSPLLVRKILKWWVLRHNNPQENVVVLPLF